MVVGRRRGSDPELLWLWLRPGATAPIRPLAWEPPYAAGAALKRQNGKLKKIKKIELQLPAYPTATATQDLRCICELATLDLEPPERGQPPHGD